MGITAFETLIYNSIFFYAVLMMISVMIVVFIASVEINKYTRKNRYVLYRELLASPHAPSVSIIAPVFNIENTVIEKVRALLVLKYNNFDVIIVNDGSTDTTFERLKDFYQLEAVDYAVNDQVKTRIVHSYYKSKNPAFAKLTVIDKASGGKADALNAGINVSEKALVFCIELSCFLDRNSLLKLVKAFLENKKRVIAAGCVVQVADSCEFKTSHLSRVKFPRRILPAFQVIEYFKSFLIERLAWSRLNGLHILSEVIGLFDKEILLLSGGYNTKALKPGIELLVRMRRYMYDNKLAHRIIYNPEPICWVKVPSDLKRLTKQRKNWAAGSLQTFRLNKDLFFNKKYGSLGIFNFPYSFLSEWITPFFKLFCLLLSGVMAIAGIINWEFIIILLLMAYSFAILLCLISLLFQEKSYRLYSSGKDVLYIVFLSFAEPLFYHPLTIYWKIAAILSKSEGEGPLSEE